MHEMDDIMAWCRKRSLEGHCELDIVDHLLIAAVAIHQDNAPPAVSLETRLVTIISNVKQATKEVDNG